jgi:mono/diheme cytochrome c family protein
MSADRRKSHLAVYVIVLIAALLIVLYVFLRTFRAGEEAASVAPPQTETTKSSAKQVNQRALAADTTLVGKGKQLFEINCSSCHGPEGYGNGPRAAGMTPPPRNYHTQKFKFGDDIVSIHNTILKGSPGTSMPSFVLLPIEDTWALAHFVYSQIPNPPPITDAQLAQVPGGSSGGAVTAAPATAGSTATAAATEATGVRIPIEVAMQQMTVPGPVTTPIQHAIAGKSVGAALYAERCASCHGTQGEGKVVRVLAVAPYRYEVSGDLTSSNSPWITDRNKFSQIVVQGLPGRTMPGQGTLTSAQLDELYSFVRSLSKVR